MSRRRRAENPVSLFPFVAVMASTMGALILLLLVTARQASKAREAAANVGPPIALPALPPLPGLAALPPLPPLPPQELPALVERPLPPLPALVDPRGAAAARLAQLKTELAELQTKRARVPQAGEERLTPLLREAAVLRNRLTRLIAARRELASAAATVADEKRQLSKKAEDVRQRAAAGWNRYAVVPYFGPNATNRRPIYLECTPAGVVLQPEGVVLQSHRLDALLPAVVRAIAETWMRAEPNAKAPPYPLLLVRPDGVETYYRARTALENLPLPFGYELVAAGRELAFPAADAAVRTMATDMIERSANAAVVASDSATSTNPQSGGSNFTGGQSPIAGMASAGRQSPRSLEHTTRSGVGGDPNRTDELPEIGSSVAEYVAMQRIGPMGRLGVGALGMQSAVAPRSDARSSNGETTQARPQSTQARPKTERTAARARADSAVPEVNLSDAIQNRFDRSEANAPARDGWKTGAVESRDRAAKNGAAPRGLWSADPPRRRQREEPASERLFDWRSALEAAANADESNREDRESEPPPAAFRARPVERTLAVLCRRDDAVLPNGDVVDVSDANAVLVGMHAEIRRWPRPRPGVVWRPVVVLQAARGGLDAMYELRAALAAAGVAVRHEWVDEAGVPLWRSPVGE